MTSTFVDRERIVIVDLNQRRYEFLKSSGAGSCWTIVHCERGAQALREARRAPAKLYVVHVALPDMSGFDVVSLLQQWDRDARFLLIADSYDRKEERRAFQLRRTKYVTPPLDALWLSRLLSTLEKRRDVAAHRCSEMQPALERAVAEPPP